MNILVYGAGGVGAFFGALLARAGQDVHFIARPSSRTGALVGVIVRKGRDVRVATPACEAMYALMVASEVPNRTRSA